MNGKTLTLPDILMGNLSKDRIEEAVSTLKGFVRETMREDILAKIEDRVEIQVEKTVLRESKDLATKGDILALKEDMNRLGGRVDTLLYCVIGSIITMVIGFASLLVALLPILLKQQTP